MTVGRIQWCQARTILNPTYTLAADYNVHAQLEATIKQMQEQCNGTTWNIHHGKGHQKGKDLTREATLNNVADTLAMEAHQALLCNRQYQTVPLYPENKLNVTIKKNHHKRTK
eukprot:12982445-Ditylum_brightwellii.AAC.1